MNEIEIHPFKPFVPANATILIVGSFPGRDITQKKLNEDDWFYGTKRNQFWDIISAVYGTELKTAADKKELFNKKGIAIADVILQARRNATNNSDSNLEVIAYNDEAIRTILTHTTFQHIFFTSKFVEKHFLKIFPGTKNGKCLPSPSPRFARMSKAEKIETYRKMLPGE
ncbi:MAG: uracil-DNA glycosylase family protein [Bacteroidota bacterium]|nr:uracil-DNA glycosylase family protein [Bacteroidota bacterium]